MVMAGQKWVNLGHSSFLSQFVQSEENIHLQDKEIHMNYWGICRKSVGSYADNKGVNVLEEFKTICSYLLLVSMIFLLFPFPPHCDDYWRMLMEDGDSPGIAPHFGS